MAVTVFPAPAAGGGIKSIQRGSTSVAGAITITAVDTTKTTVNSFSTASTGAIALAGTTSGSCSNVGSGGTQSVGMAGQNQSFANISSTGSTNTLVSQVAGAYLSLSLIHI